MKDYQFAVMEVARKYKFSHPFVQCVHSRSKKERPPYRPIVNNRGYPVVSFRSRTHGIDCCVDVHRAVAFQQFGDAVFEEGVQVRHLNNDKSDFRIENLALGSAMDNFLDHAPETIAKIHRAGRIGAKMLRRFSDEEIRSIRRRHSDGQSIKGIARMLDCASSTISYIVNMRHYAEV